MPDFMVPGTDAHAAYHRELASVMRGDVDWP